MVYGVDMFLISVSRSSIFLVFQDYFLLKNSSLAFNNYFLEFYNSRNSSKIMSNVSCDEYFIEHMKINPKL